MDLNYLLKLLTFSSLICACESFERSLKRLLSILHTFLQNFPRANDLSGKAGWAKSLQLKVSKSFEFYSEDLWNGGE